MVTEEDIQAAEAAVEEQAAWIRSMKETEGRTNADPLIQGAVLELKNRKQRVDDLKKGQAEALAALEAAFDDE
jgi:hypothetical protein